MDLELALIATTYKGAPWVFKVEVLDTQGSGLITIALGKAPNFLTEELILKGGLSILMEEKIC